MSVPALRFKDDDGRDFTEWKKSELQDIAQINPKSDFLPDEFIYIDLESVEKGTLLKETKVSKSEAPSRAQRLLQKNDVLFQMVRPYQGNNLFFDKSGDYVASTGYAQIQTLENPRFLYHYLHLEAFTAEVINRCTGTSYPAINSSRLLTIPVAFPSKPEQTKIANFLTAVDAKIKQLTQKCELLAQYKNGVMQQIFSQELRFKDDDGQGFPEWKECEFGKVYEFIPTNSYSREMLTYEGGAIQNIHYGDIHTRFKSNFNLTNEHVPFLSNEVDVSKIKDSQFCRNGDIVIADASEDYADVGKAIEVIEVDSKMLVAGLHTYLARNMNNKLALGFGGYLMQSSDVRYQIKVLATGVSVLSISKGNLAKVNIKLPCKAEQARIASFLTTIDDKLTHTKNQLEAAKQYKQGLLQQMFV